MAAFLERLGIFARSPDARPLAEIAADIDEELEFHVEESARALEQAGLAPELARAEALKRFGDYGRIRRECARTWMGERIMLQRIQLVLTAALVAAVGILAWSNQRAQVQARAAMDAERQRTEAVLARVEARLGEPRVVGPVTFPQAEAGAKPMQIGSGGYLNIDGQEMDLDSAAETWLGEFQAQDTAWRHGLRLAERLSALPGAQGAEILAQIWSRLSVEHREQAMKPFVFDGGHPNALEVLQLGFENQPASVKERAVLYLHTYAWKNLWTGEATGSEWFAEFRDRPVAEVLTANATRWAREFAYVVQTYEQLPAEGTDDLLDAAAKVDPAVFAKSGVDLGALLLVNGVGALTESRLGLLGAEHRAAALRVLSWCKR